MTISNINDVLMLSSSNEELYKSAIKAWGESSQILMCVEECAELQKNLLHELRLKKTVRREDILDELVDVQIMIEQMRLVYRFSPLEFLEQRAKKLKRLSLRIKEFEGADNAV